MSKMILAQNEEIVIGVDVSDHAHHLAVASARGEILADRVLKPPDHKAWLKFLSRNLPGCSIRVVYEAGPHGYTLYDTLTGMGVETFVIAPVKAIGIKTNRRDARAIARDFLASRVRIITVPSFDKRVHRQVIRQRAQIQKEIKRARNRINAIRRFHGLAGCLLSPGKDTGGYLAFCIMQQEELVEFLSKKRKELDMILDTFSGAPAYSEDVKTLTGIVGIGTLSALEILLGVADIRAFSSAGEFASYTGLCPGEWSTGETRRMGHISRRGPGRLRGVLVQCAWVAVAHNKETGAGFGALAARIGRKRAITAIARRLAERVWRALNGRCAQRAA